MNQPSVDVSAESAAESVTESVNENPSRAAQTFAYYGVFVAMGLLLCVLGPTLPGLARHTGASLGDASLLFMARSAGFLLGSFFVGRVYDRRAGHPVMAAAAGVMTLIIVLLPLMDSLAPLVALTVLQGLTGSALNVGSNTLLVWAHGGRPGPYLNGLHFSFGVGALVSPLLVERSAALSGDVNWAYWSLTLVFAPLAALLLRLPSPPPRHDSPHDAGGQFPWLLVALVAAFFVLYTGAESSAASWLFNYTLATRLADAGGAAYLNSAFWALLTAGRLLVIPLLGRFRPRTILYCDLAGCVASVGVILLWPGSLAALWAGACGLGLSMASIFPTMLSLAARRVALTGKITGWFFAGSSVGSMLLPWLVGHFFESTGPRVLPAVILADLLLAAVVLTALLLHYSRPTHVAPRE
jgi:MFS transporter, FHS family, Na+ dependent glucose transporter 1